MGVQGTEHGERELGGVPLVLSPVKVAWPEEGGAALPLILAGLLCHDPRWPQRCHFCPAFLSPSSMMWKVTGPQVPEGNMPCR